jgi:DNA mismatch repair protein MutS2
VIYPENFESKLGFTKIRESLKDLCLCNLGRELVDEMNFTQDKEHLDLLLDQTNDFRQICIEEDNFPLNNYIDARKELEKARIIGSFLTLKELFDLKRALETIKAVVNFFKNCDPEKYQTIRRSAMEVKIFSMVFDMISRVMTPYGKMKDNASPELQEIRSSIRRKQASVTRKMESILRGAIDSGLVERETTVSIRDGRAVIPISASNKRKLNGIIHDQSATGKTAYVEPAEIVEINNDIKDLLYAEQREIVKILQQITENLRPYIDDLLLQFDFLALIDFVRAKAKYAIQTDAIRIPVSDEQIIDLKQARHPLLDLLLRRQKQKIVPLNIKLSRKNRVLLISGPNAGGKSVCLQTVGLIQYMLQCGMLVSVDEGSKAGMFSGIFVDMGDEQSIENDLSTYSSHLMNMKHFLRHCSDSTLILIDEFGTGTEPQIGGAIAQSILEELRTKETFGVITTHYTNLKHYASSSEGVVNGAMLFDTGKIEPLFKLQIGQPGSSFAFDIARKIGLPETILKSASEQVGEDHVDFDKNLRQIVRDKYYWQQKREKIRVSEKKLGGIVDDYTSELKDIKKLRREILDEAKAQAESILADANKRIEKTIRDIKVSQAEKERTKKARKDLDEFKDSVTDNSAEENEKIERKLQKLKRRDERLKTKKENAGKDDNNAKPGKESKKTTLEKGAKVRIKGQTAVGEVMDITSKSVMVAFGGLITSVTEKRLEVISNNEYKREVRSQRTGSTINYSESISKRKLNFKQEIDVRGVRAEEALYKVQEHVDNAIMVDAPEIRILHGKGNGILRQLIREYLSGVDLVESYKDERVDFGGAGITIVKFSR